MLFRNVLFPFDYSPRCRHVEPFIKRFIDRTGAHLTVINVIEDPRSHYPSSTAFIIPPSELDEILTASKKFLREQVKEAFPGCEPDTICKMGEPAKEIVRAANENNIDLIIMPTRGRGSFRPLLLGSVTAKVLDEVSCPVWTDAHGEEPRRALKFPVERILCAVNQKQEDAATIRSAAEVAQMCAAKLALIHVLPELDPGLKMLRPEWVHEVRERARNQIASLCERAGVDAEICIQEGPISLRIQQAAMAQKADLVVIGRGHLQRFLGRLRTNAYAIIRDSPCPVLSF